MREFGPRGHSATSSHNGGSRHRALLRARRERPRRRSAAEKRDELAPLQLIQLHSVPASRGQITGYRIGEDQSGDNETILQPVGRSLCSRWYCSILFSTEILFATRPMFKSRFQIAGEALAIAALSASAAAFNRGKRRRRNARHTASPWRKRSNDVRLCRSRRRSETP